MTVKLPWRTGVQAFYSTTLNSIMLKRPGEHDPPIEKV
jgi:hypothetical protein